MKTRTLVLGALMAALTGVLAYVRIPLPFSPVPVSGQTLAVMLAGTLLGPRAGALSQLVYVLMGAIGLPVYAGGLGGPAVLAGPTGGYLLGFIAGAYVTGLLTHDPSRRSPARLALGYALGGVVAVYIPGVLQLALVTGMGFPQALAAGALPFLPGDALKVGLALVLVRALRSVSP